MLGYTTEEIGYHDVTVFVNGTPYKISDHYDLELSCNRVGGWCLWRKWGDKSELIGGEFNHDDFRIEVSGVVVCGKGRVTSWVDRVLRRVGIRRED